MDYRKTENNVRIQIENGELAGIGTGASVWPAAHVLCKYLEGRYGAGGEFAGLLPAIGGRLGAEVAAC